MAEERRGVVERKRERVAVRERKESIAEGCEHEDDSFGGDEESVA